METGILHRIQALHRRVVRLERWRVLSMTVTILLVALAAAVALDALVRWPAVVRFLLLAAGLVGAVRLARRAADRGWRRVPGAASLALRLERVEPSLQGTLASAYDFARTGQDRHNALAASVIQRAQEQAPAGRLERHVRAGAPMATVACALVALGAWIVAACLHPTGTQVGLRRTLTPWTGDRWPARVTLQSEPLPGAVARGASVDIAVRVTQGDDPGLRVRALCVLDGSAQGEREFDLMRQPDGSFRRSVTAEGDRMTIRVSAGDAESDPQEIQVRTPPAIARGELDVQPPAYAAHQRPALHLSWQGVAAGDPGMVLEGSVATLQLELAAPASDPSSGEPMVRVFTEGQANTTTPLVVAQDPRHWTIQVSMNASGRLDVLPRDTDGVAAIEPLRIAWRVAADIEPTVSVTEPETDESVTMEATVPFQVEARDDLALARVGWKIDRQQRSGEPAPVVLGESRQEASGSEARVKDTLSVAALKAQVGDVLQLRGLASDRFERQGVHRSETVSEPRRLRVIEREAFERQARQQAGTIREAASRLESAQREVERETDLSTAARSQVGLAERVRDATQSGQKLVQRLRRNGLSQGTLSDTLQEATELGSQAEAQARQAGDALQRADKGQAGAREQAKMAQRQAGEALQRMVELLDRDDDAAGAQRRADRLAETIDGLRKDLKKASRSGMGKDPEDLSQQERQAMQEQAARQRAAAEEAAAMIEELRGRAERAQVRDRSQAAALRQAADEGERGQASRRLDEAAERTDRNQATAADEAMQAAAEAVDKVRSSLREDRRARTEDLKRRLASLAETLQALLRQAEEGARQVDALATLPTKPVDETCGFLSRLARNTVGAAEEARQAGGASQKAPGVLVRAGDRFEASVVALRAVPAVHETARDEITRGIDLLREGLQEVQRAQREQQARQSEQERAQLARQYRQLAADTQTVRQATAGTLAADGGRVDRRGAAVQREQALRLAGIERALEQGPRKSELLKGAATFQALHQRIAQDLTTTRTALEGAQGDAATVRRLDIVAEGFLALAACLTDPDQPEDPFADAKQQDQDGGGGGAGGGDQEGKQALPPIAELRLVRQMQAQVQRLTSTLDAARQSGQSVNRETQDLAVMQEEGRRLGQDWVDRMSERRKRRTPNSDDAPTTAPPSMPLSFPWQGAAPQSNPPADGSVSTRPTDPAPATPPPTTETRPAPRTLDELLGISGGSDDQAAQAQRDRKLERSLKEEDLGDLAKAALESMQVATAQLRERQDIGVGTQRVQADAVANLDALIDAATRFQKQQNASRSSSSRQSSGSKQQGKDRSSEQAGGEKPEAQPGKGESSTQAAGERRNAAGTTGDQVEPPMGGDEAASGALMEGRSEWGHLPRRIREIMSQARRDPVSALYQQATEAYYRRLAEDRKP